jgi:3-hydroxy-9,10-secoandrosta-1,3,5(10)-triene-9,17-dione monooxygenase
MLTPGRLGGRETRMRTVVAVTELLGVVDGSAAWLVALSTAHAWMAGLFSERAQQDVFGADPDAVIAGRIARVAGAVEDPSAEHVDGGVRVGGRFAYASGSHHAKWLLLGARTVDEASHPADLLICLAATSELRVEDTWHTVGLRGTGSNTWVAEDLFGPEPSEREPGRYQRRNRGLLSSPLVASWCAGAVEAFARKGDLAYPYRRLRSHMGADV